MLNRSILSLFLLVSFGSMHAMDILHDIDASLLGQPQHHVVVLDGDYRTVYAAYPKDVLATLDQRKLVTQGATAFSTASLLYTGLSAISNAIANSWNYVAAPSIAPRHVSAYLVLSGLSYALARYSWHAYDNVVKLYQRITSHNAQDSLFASDIPATTLPNNAEIAAINAENPNLIWVRTSHGFNPPPAYDEPAFAVAPPFENDAQLQQMYPNIQSPSAIMHAPMPAAQPAPAHLQCSLCSNAINKQNTADNMALPCGHVFHSKCIRPIVIPNPNATCPECATPVRPQ